MKYVHNFLSIHYRSHLKQLFPTISIRTPCLTKSTHPLCKKNKCPISKYIVPDKDEEQEENYKNNKHLSLRRELETQSQFLPRKTITSQREKDGISSASKFKKKKSYSKPHVAVFVAANVDPNSNPQHFKKKKNDHTVSLSSFNFQPLASDVLQSQSLAVNLDFIFQIFAYRIDELEIKL